MNRQAVAPDGRKQQGSANTGAFRYSYKTLSKDHNLRSPRSIFTIWHDNDPLNQPHLLKRGRKDSNRKRSLVERDINKIFTLSPADSRQELEPTKAPSLKSKGNTSNSQKSARDSRASLAMGLSSPANPVSHSNSSVLLPRLTATPQSPAIPFPVLLKSPFKPSIRRSRHKKIIQAAATPLLRRPSEGVAPQRSRFLDSRRHPSDSLTFKKRNTANPFLRDLAPFPKAQRQASFLDDLQKPLLATPKVPDLYKSPPIIGDSFGPAPEQIPRIPTLLDTPGNDTDQLIADMSEFSLAPKPGSLQLTPPFNTPIQDVLVSMQRGDSTPASIIQSSPGISIPSINDSWFSDKECNYRSTPLKGIASSEDELNLFLPVHTFPPTGLSEQCLITTQATLNDDLRAYGHLRTARSVKRSNKTYGKRKLAKSVKFASTINGTVNALHSWRRQQGGEQRSSDERMDTSDDELLLK